eukprot:TRINITY_DN3481_c0_g1_i10.p1 TRINITY_DN3481_c0_g1~~TRINITY_DN3481_c0_g1_i10.p1  ORF type:complete len:101 (+),score=7.15 TRINITY_DN3481_c0_g1_i10:243-545(+)
MLETRVLEESATHGCLGDSVKSLKSVPPEVLQEDLRRVQSSDDYDNASCYYSTLARTEAGQEVVTGYYEIQHERCMNWKFKHDTKATVRWISLRSFPLHG